jgi:hypothetical protein
MSLLPLVNFMRVADYVRVPCVISILQCISNVCLGMLMERDVITRLLTWYHYSAFIPHLQLPSSMAGHKCVVLFCSLRKFFGIRIEEFIVNVMKLTWVASSSYACGVNF